MHSQTMEPPEYIPYPRAMALLNERLKATPAEVAAWVWLGPNEGGLFAYLNANELAEPPQFFFNPHGDNGDAYLDELAHAWFRLDEVRGFEPAKKLSEKSSDTLCKC
jgi:hypothetical protein